MHRCIIDKVTRSEIKEEEEKFRAKLNCESPLVVESDAQQ
jgi:hypothetical protein